MIIFIFGSLLCCILDILFFYLTSVLCSRQCGYDCSKCQDWHCNSHYCNKKRKEILKKEVNGRINKKGEFIND